MSWHLVTVRSFGRPKVRSSARGVRLSHWALTAGRANAPDAVNAGERARVLMALWG